MAPQTGEAVGRKKQSWLARLSRRIRGRGTITVGVDLRLMQPGGANGGVKPLVFSFLAEIGRLGGGRFRFVYFVQPALAPEMQAFARSFDAVVTGDYAATDFDVLYAPFGRSAMMRAEIPTVSLIVDLLHRDLPEALPIEEVNYRHAWFTQVARDATFFQCISHYTAARLQHHYGVDARRCFVTHVPVQGRLESPEGGGQRSEARSQKPEAGSQRAEDGGRRAEGGNQRSEVGGQKSETRGQMPEAGGRRTEDENQKSEGGSQRVGAGEGRYFFYPANSWPHKNHEALFEAFRRYRAVGPYPAWSLVLTGHPDERMRWLAERAAALGLEGSVRFLGHLSEREFADVWRGAGALVYPSLHEGFGIPLLEAMAFGVPIVAANTTSLPEVGGDACVYVDPRNETAIAAALAEIATNESLRADLTRRGRQRLQAFSLKREAGKLAEHLRQATDRS
jgi:glycosyltransferase involved in cell wall biosynthesis